MIYCAYNMFKITFQRNISSMLQLVNINDSININTTWKSRMEYHTHTNIDVYILFKVLSNDSNISIHIPLLTTY